MFSKEQIINRNPYLSVILPTYNMEKYIEKALLSILNQSFQDFEIIIINDCSKDNTKDIIKLYELFLNKIKIIEHERNLGIYASRVDGLMKSNGKYILFVDPDDLIFNPHLFKQIYNYNNKYNLDIIEFMVYYKKEGNITIYIPKSHRSNHFHNFSQAIIYQPNVSNLLFFEPGKFNYSDIICRTIWNKIIKKNILLKTINFIRKYFYKNENFNFAEDTIMNIINFQYAHNYSNIKIPGYLYNIRNKSISHGNFGIKHETMLYYHFLLYLKLFHKYIKHFNKNRNYLFFELKQFKNYLLKLKSFNISKYINAAKLYLNDLLKDKYISKDFKNFIINLTYIFKI